MQELQRLQQLRDLAEDWREREAGAHSLDELLQADGLQPSASDER